MCSSRSLSRYIVHRLNVLESTAKVDTRGCRRIVLPRRSEQGSLREHMRQRTNVAIAERLARISSEEGFFTREHREHLAHISSREKYLGEEVSSVKCSTAETTRQGPEHRAAPAAAEGQLRERAVPAQTGHRRTDDGLPP